MSPLTVYKLVILHMLSRAEGKMQASYLAFFLLENGYANLVNLARTFGELEERELVEISADRLLHKIDDLLVGEVRRLVDRLHPPGRRIAEVGVDVDNGIRLDVPHDDRHAVRLDAAESVLHRQLHADRFSQSVYQFLEVHSLFLSEFGAL